MALTPSVPLPRTSAGFGVGCGRRGGKDVHFRFAIFWGLWYTPARRKQMMFAGVAQLVEHLLAKEKVAGSNPVSRSIHPSVNDWWVFFCPKFSSCFRVL
jgi:hypothetical protein